MSFPDPPWKVKTRPCPFYQQGRCYFADGCNFLHEVKIKSTPTIRDSKPVHTDLRRGTQPILPAVTVDSPSSVLSSPRSPRMASLLLALSDVIGPDYSPYSSSPEPNQSPCNENGSEASSDAGSPDSGHGSDEGEVESGNGSDEGEAEVEDDGEGKVEVEVEVEEEVEEESPVEEPDELDEPTARQENPSPDSLESVDSDIHDNAHRRSLGLLSPVDISGPPIPFPAEGIYDGSLHREDSIDSGYADNWGPTPFALSPPRPAYRHSSMFDLLSSPFGSPSSRILMHSAHSSPQLSAVRDDEPFTLGPSALESSSRSFSPSVYAEEETQAMGSETAHPKPESVVGEVQSVKAHSDQVHERESSHSQDENHSPIFEGEPSARESFSHTREEEESPRLREQDHAHSSVPTTNSAIIPEATSTFGKRESPVVESDFSMFEIRPSNVESVPSPHDGNSSNPGDDLSINEDNSVAVEGDFSAFEGSSPILEGNSDAPDGDSYDPEGDSYLPEGDSYDLEGESSILEDTFSTSFDSADHTKLLFPVPPGLESLSRPITPRTAVIQDLKETFAARAALSAPSPPKTFSSMPTPIPSPPPPQDTHRTDYELSPQHDAEISPAITVTTIRGRALSELTIGPGPSLPATKRLSGGDEEIVAEPEVRVEVEAEFLIGPETKAEHDYEVEREYDEDEDEVVESEARSESSHDEGRELEIEQDAAFGYETGDDTLQSMYADYGLDSSPPPSSARRSTSSSVAADPLRQDAQEDTAQAIHSRSSPRSSRSPPSLKRSGSSASSSLAGTLKRLNAEDDTVQTMLSDFSIVALSSPSHSPPKPFRFSGSSAQIGDLPREGTRGDPVETVYSSSNPQASSSPSPSRHSRFSTSSSLVGDLSRDDAQIDTAQTVHHNFSLQSSPPSSPVKPSCFSASSSPSEDMTRQDAEDDVVSSMYADYGLQSPPSPSKSSRFSASSLARDLSGQGSQGNTVQTRPSHFSLQASSIPSPLKPSQTGDTSRSDPEDDALSSMYAEYGLQSSPSPSPSKPSPSSVSSLAGGKSRQDAVGNTVQSRHSTFSLQESSPPSHTKPSRFSASSSRTGDMSRVDGENTPVSSMYAEYGLQSSPSPSPSKPSRSSVSSSVRDLSIQNAVGNGNTVQTRHSNLSRQALSSPSSPNPSRFSASSSLARDPPRKDMQDDTVQAMRSNPKVETSSAFPSIFPHVSTSSSPVGEMSTQAAQGNTVHVALPDSSSQTTTSVHPSKPSRFSTSSSLAGDLSKRDGEYDAVSSMYADYGLESSLSPSSLEPSRLSIAASITSSHSRRDVEDDTIQSMYAAYSTSAQPSPVAAVEDRTRRASGLGDALQSMYATSSASIQPSASASPSPSPYSSSFERSQSAIELRSHVEMTIENRPPQSSSAAGPSVYRQPVFTPPVSKTESRESSRPSSALSVISSNDKGKGRETGIGAGADLDQASDGGSRKVPFGFRHSFKGRAIDVKKSRGPSRRTSLADVFSSHSNSAGPGGAEVDLRTPGSAAFLTSALDPEEGLGHSPLPSPLPGQGRSVLKPLRLSMQSFVLESISRRASTISSSGHQRNPSISSSSVSSGSLSGHPLLSAIQPSSSHSHSSSPPYIPGPQSQRNSLVSISPHAHDTVTTRPTIRTSYSNPPTQSLHLQDRRSSGAFAPETRHSREFPLQSAPPNHSQTWRNSVSSFLSLHSYSRSTSRLSEPIIHESEHSEGEEDDDDNHNGFDTGDDDPTTSSRYSYLSRADLDDTTIRHPLRHPTFDRISAHNRISASLPASRPSSRSQNLSPFASPSLPSSPAPIPSPALSHHSMHAIATPQPTLMFAIASDDPAEVRRVLESGQVGPNDEVGPQSALAFAVGNDKLNHRVEIVKILLAHGADPKGLTLPIGSSGSSRRSSAAVGGESSTENLSSSSSVLADVLESMDPATRYYVARADAAHTRKTSALIHRSFFRPLTKVRFDIVGQDRAFEQLFMVLNAHSRMLSVAPIVVLLCGPSGHGKSLLARKFGNLLDVPTHTVNMTTLRSTHDIWQSYSMSPYEEPSSYTLTQFLLENEGKRCVVVLDEIEKTEDPKALYSLLMPWEIGRCSPQAGDRHIDVRKVIWIGTSNIGHDTVFQYQSSLPSSNTSTTMSRKDYIRLADMLRPKVSERLGASLLSRVTSVLPFIPFSQEEKMAIATEAMYSVGGDVVAKMEVEKLEKLANKVVKGWFVEEEGARSLYRGVSEVLLDLDEDEDVEED